MERGRIIVNNTDYTGSFVTPNPSEPPTKDLNTLEIEGEVFNIAGGGGTNLIVDAQIYSLEEKQVGVWTDGKPIYQKTVISTTTPSQNTWTTIQLDLPTDAVVTKYEAYYRRSPNRTDFIPQYNPTGSNEWLFGALSNNNFVYKVGSPYVANFLETYITVWYTKTTDTAGSGGFQAYGFTPVIYSTEEREVGVWTDNKPLYQKTWVLNNEILLNSNGVTINEIDASMVEHLVSCYGNYQPLSNTKSIPVLVWKYNNSWYYGSSIAAYVDTITLLYTKTADVAGSGEYNTLGVPNVHCDNTEKVIGTWFGETLYERTLNIGSISSANDGYVIGDKATLKIKDCVELYGKCTYETNGEKQTIALPNYNTSTYYIRIYYESDLGIMLNIPSLNGKAGIWFEYSNDAFQYYNNDIYVTIRYTKTTD